MNSSITFYSDSPNFAAALELAKSDGDTKPSRSRSSSSAASATESMAAVKKAMAAAKREHGEDFVLQVLEEVGKTTKPEQTIGRQLSACAASNHEAMIEAFEAGPGEDEAEVDADAVKMAIKAYAKEEGKAAAKKKLKKFDLTLSDLDDLDEEDEDTLAEIMKAFS